MADNSSRIPTSEIHTRSTVTPDAIRDLLLGPQTVPPPENSFEPRSVGEARVSMGDPTMVGDRNTSDSRGPAPPAGVGAAGNSATVEFEPCQIVTLVNGMESVPSIETGYPALLPQSLSVPVESFLAPGQSFFMPHFAQSPPTARLQGSSSLYSLKPSLSQPFTPMFPFGSFSKGEQPPPVEQPNLAAPGMSEAMMKLATFWHDENADINSMDAAHEIWRNPEMPLARIKKIMRIDEDVKMISAEVPVLFSKAASIFIRELTLRAWIQTEEAKRRTLQRSDIALAITKYDMFDFLIDIVPRDEIQVKPTRKQEENHPVLTAEQLQLLVQLSQSQHQGQGQVAASATVHNTTQEDDQHPPSQPPQALMTSPNKASLETLHQLLQLQLLQQQLSANAAQPHSTEPTGVHREPA